jgi:hypothetical protein
MSAPQRTYENPMIDATPVPLAHRLRRPPLAAAVVAGLLALGASTCAPGGVTANTDIAGPQLRTDPARRIFAQLPAPRSAPGRVQAAATIWPVTTCADDNAGSLRSVIKTAADGDIIDLTALTCATITLETGAIAIPFDNLTLNGPGRDALTIDGHQLDRVFVHPYGGTLTVRAMTIQGGRNRATGFQVAGGGCIASAGYVTLDNTTVRNCYAGGEGAYGGAIYAYSLTMANSTLSGNRAYGVHESAGTAAFGGAAFVYSMQLSDSTISGNRAEHLFNANRTSYDIGGGLITVRGGRIANSTIDSNTSYGRGGGIAAFNPVAISNSTLSGNIAQTDIGGALFLRGSTTLQANNSTFTANYAQAGGGGIWIAASTSELQSDLLFGNSTDTGDFADLQSSSPLAISGANNLIGNAGPSVALPADTLTANPLLGALTDNGGPTRTHALGAGSPAVDAGNNLANLSFDQRGTPFPRVHGAAADIGAFEQQALPAPVVQTPVPALSSWMMALLAACLALIAICKRTPRRLFSTLVYGHTPGEGTDGHSDRQRHQARVPRRAAQGRLVDGQYPIAPRSR